MIWEVLVFKTWGLLQENFLLEVTVDKCGFDIHLIDSEVLERGIGKKKSDGFQPCNRGKGFVVVEAFQLEIGRASCRERV